MCEVREDGRLLAVSLFDVGHEATSSIYAMFEPEESHRGLGHFTLILELLYARERGKRFLYTGYAHRTESYYDYKKRYRGSEFYDWRARWRPWDELSDDLFPTHRYEISDIPEELLVSDEDSNESDEPNEPDEPDEPDEPHDLNADEPSSEDPSL